jgi:stearoyl-CoA desaturase (delta-9 desaturase)
MEADTVETAGGNDPFPFHHDNWFSKVLVVVFVVAPLLAFGYAIWSFWGSQVGPLQIGLMAGMWAFSGLGVSLGFHRMLTHRAFSARAPTRAILLIAGTMSLQGPPADWAATHIRHHAKADREGDPHSPLEGFWHAHFGWLLRDRFVRDGPAHDRIMLDPVVRFAQKTWIVWATLGFILPGLLGLWLQGGLWGFVDGVLWGGLVRVFLGHHLTWSVNSLGHMLGTRPFKTTDQATNNFAIALFGWGEGWHNNHHAFPRAAYMGMRWYQVDIGKWVIRGLRMLGQIKSVWMPTRAERKARRRRQRTPTTATH